MFLKVLRIDTVDVGECDLEEELIKVFKFTATHCLLIIVNGIIYVPTMTSIDSLNPCVAAINKQFHFVKAQQVPVPHSKSGIVPRSSLVGAGQLGFWEVGKGGTIG